MIENESYCKVSQLEGQSTEESHAIREIFVSRENNFDIRLEIGSSNPMTSLVNFIENFNF